MIIRPGLFQRRITMAATLASISVSKHSFDELLARLIQTADEAKLAEVVAPLTPAQRASLAVFCYSRAHLNSIGLAIAATCELNTLLQAAPSNACGQAIFAQSRQRPKAEDRRATGARARITLARSASGNSALAAIIANLAQEEDIAEPLSA
jgi:hypothetical protein